MTYINCIKSHLQTKNIRLTNLVGFESDTTNVMVGQNKSVFSHLKEDIPKVVCVRCSCYMIHFAASKASWNCHDMYKSH